MKRVAKAAGWIGFCRRTGSPTLWWIPPPLRATPVASGRRWVGRAPVAHHGEALGAGRASPVAGGQGPRGRGRGSPPSAPGLGNPEAGASEYDDPPPGVTQEAGAAGDEPDQVARATGGVAPGGGGAGSPGALAGCAAVCPSHVSPWADCRGGSRASCPAASLDRREDRQGAPGDAAQRDGDQWGLVVGDGIFWLARLQESSGSGRRSGLHADPISKRRKSGNTGSPKSGNRPVRWITRSWRGVGGACSLTVPCVCWCRQRVRQRRQALATDGDGGRSASSSSWRSGASSTPGWYRGGGARKKA